MKYFFLFTVTVVNSLSCSNLDLLQLIELYILSQDAITLLYSSVHPHNLSYPPELLAHKVSQLPPLPFSCSLLLFSPTHIQLPVVPLIFPLSVIFFLHLSLHLHLSLSISSSGFYHFFSLYLFPAVVLCFVLQWLI